jgi:hypothetical protein
VLDLRLFARQLTATVLTVVATSSLAGPGNSGGNPNTIVASPARNYVFQGPPPTAPKIDEHGDRYDFGLAGYSLDVTPRPYDPAQCAATNAVKTVCARGPTAAVVVFGDHRTFLVTVRDTGIGPARLGLLAPALIESFAPITVGKPVP